MAAERLGADVGETGFFLADVATGAAIHDVDFGKPDLVNPAFKVTLESHRVAASANEFQILVLVMAPLAEVILRRSDGELDQQQHADHAKSANGITKERLPERVVAG